MESLSGTIHQSEAPRLSLCELETELRREEAEDREEESLQTPNTHSLPSFAPWPEHRFQDFKREASSRTQGSDHRWQGLKRASRYSACRSKHACGSVSFLHLFSHLALKHLLWPSSSRISPRGARFSCACVGKQHLLSKWSPLKDIVLCLTFCVTNCCRTWP